MNTSWLMERAISRGLELEDPVYSGGGSVRDDL